MNTEFAIFDWNGTLINDFSIHYAVVSEILKNFGIQPLSIKEFKNKYRIPYMRFYRKMGITKEMATKEKLDALYVAFYKKQKNKTPVKLFPDAKKTLIWLRDKGIKTAILSSYPQDGLTKLVETKGLISLFDYIIGGIYYKKIGLRKFVEALKIPNNHVFYVDDLMQGVLAAKKAGLIAVGFLNGWHGKERILKANPDFAIKNLWELTKIITEGDKKFKKSK